MRKSIFFCLCCFFASQSYAATLTGIRLSANSLSFRFSSTTAYKHFQLKNPTRIVFDFKRTKLLRALKKKHFHSNLIKSIRRSESLSGDVRVVLDMKTQTRFKIKRSWGKSDFRLTIQFLTPKIAYKPVGVRPTMEMRSNTKLRQVVVVIDPGHGGKDPGAIGKRGVREKTVVLSIAKKLKALIDKQAGMRAKLTRRGDYYIPLRKRLELARESDADIFISIHADAFKNSRSSGVSVYALSQRGATSEAARWIAEKENYSELGGVDLSGLNDKSGLVRSVLIDLSQTATIGASLKLGMQVLSHLDRLTVLHHDKVEQARFVVLKSPDIPSILIETGFISNRKEERLLASPRYQQKLASQILTGIKHYFKAYPPRNSRLARAD